MNENEDNGEMKAEAAKIMTSSSSTKIIHRSIGGSGRELTTFNGVYVPVLQ
jgi:hypothetical protein